MAEAQIAVLQKCVIWKRYINKLKLEKKELPRDLLYAKVCTSNVSELNFMLLEWG